MFMEFLEKITNWVLDKEEESAKNCQIPIDDIAKQLQILEDKRDELQKKCDEQLKIFNNLISRLERIKAEEALKCENKKKEN